MEGKGAHEWMIEFKILLQMYHNSRKHWWIYTTLNRLRNATTTWHLNPLINVARKNLFYDWLKTTTSCGNIKLRLSNQRDYLELKSMQLKLYKIKLKIPFISWLHFYYKFLRTATECVVALEEFVKFLKTNI
jgi:hypothetical protein